MTLPRTFIPDFVVPCICIPPMSVNPLKLISIPLYSPLHALLYWLSSDLFSLGTHSPFLLLLLPYGLVVPQPRKLKSQLGPPFSLPGSVALWAQPTDPSWPHLPTPSLIKGEPSPLGISDLKATSRVPKRTSKLLSVPCGCTGQCHTPSCLDIEPTPKAILVPGLASAQELDPMLNLPPGDPKCDAISPPVPLVYPGQCHAPFSLDDEANCKPGPAKMTVPMPPRNPCPTCEPSSQQRLIKPGDAQEGERFSHLSVIDAQYRNSDQVTPYVSQFVSYKIEPFAVPNIVPKPKPSSKPPLQPNIPDYLDIAYPMLAERRVKENRKGIDPLFPSPGPSLSSSNHFKVICFASNTHEVFALEVSATSKLSSASLSNSLRINRCEATPYNGGSEDPNNIGSEDPNIGSEEPNNDGISTEDLQILEAGFKHINHRKNTIPR
ncbi:uncharacterized protein LOC135214194 [Macrobrachium nipponense]|uniref:uncharacterized protein LOC135214194 n=1 Tax=Macrobrachium nipponense TaxID=159736 RepID=UPI0030C7BC61